MGQLIGPGDCSVGSKERGRHGHHCVPPLRARTSSTTRGLSDRWPARSSARRPTPPPVLGSAQVLSVRGGNSAVVNSHYTFPFEIQGDERQSLTLSCSAWIRIGGQLRAEAGTARRLAETLEEQQPDGVG